MPCYYPLDCWKAKSPNENGRYGITFSIREAQLDQPLQVPCGKCHGCRADQSLMWSIRAYHESTLHLKNSFLTLTYDEAHLPSDGKINKKHLQDFFKRARKTMKLRYIACGEYGEKTHRPHYHAIIFGQDFLDDKIDLGDDLYTNQRITDLWGHGQVAIAPVTMASICYTCGYTLKKIGNDDTFPLMSRRPGIGHDWLKLYKDDLVRTGIVTIEGREFPVPKRYLEWEEEDLADLKIKRAQIAKSKDFMTERESLRNREKNKRALLKKRDEKL